MTLSIVVRVKLLKLKRTNTLAKQTNINHPSSPIIKAPVFSLSKKLDHYCLVLVGSRNGFERDFTIELK